jgi:hypothetical protein
MRQSISHRVYLYIDMLALFAAAAYEPPSSSVDLARHLTNTSLQGDAPPSDAVRRFQDLPLSNEQRQQVVGRIAEIVGDTWQAALGSGPQFQVATVLPHGHTKLTPQQPLPNAFELYGVDFLLDESLQLYLLEINAVSLTRPLVDYQESGSSQGPDFKQTGETLSSLIDGLFDATLRTAVAPHFGTSLAPWAEGEERWGMRKCLDVAVRSWT